MTAGEPLVGQPGQVRRTALGRGPFQDQAKPPGPGRQWRLGPAESAPDCLGSWLVDGVTVNWPAVSAPNYRDRQLRN